MGLTACGHEGGWMHGEWNAWPAGARTYPGAGAAQAIWVRGAGSIWYRDADGDGWGSADDRQSGREAPAGYVASRGDCDDADGARSPDAQEVCDGADQDCDGRVDDGAGCSLDSCLAILTAQPGSTDGVYTIEPEAGVPVDVWCDMTTDGGGWTLGLLKTSATASSLVDFGAGYVGTGALATHPTDASLSAADLTGWLDLNVLAWTTLRVGAYWDGALTFTSADIARTDLRVAFGEDGYYLWNDPNGYVWCGGERSFTDDGLGQVNQPEGAPDDCKEHGGLGSGWDFSDTVVANSGLTACGHEGGWMHGGWNDYWGHSRAYPEAGAAQAFWVR